MKKFTCKNCGWGEVEEVLPGVTQFSVIDDVKVIDGDIILDYSGKTTYDGGDDNESYYQCSMCCERVSREELEALADEE